MKKPNSNIRGQSGAVLIISLLILLIMTILAISISQTSTLQERMAGNERDLNAAFQASEAGLRGAEQIIHDTAQDSISHCDDLTQCLTTSTNYFYGVDLSSQIKTWWTTNGVEYGTSGTQDIAGIYADPRYVVEKRGEVPDDLLVTSQSTGKIEYYEVTSHAYGKSDTAEVVTQSIYAKR